MSLEELIRLPLWSRFSKKIAEKVEKPHNSGHFTQEDAENRGMHFASSHIGDVKDGEAISLFWLVDPSDGNVVDAKFQLFGPPSLIAAAEAACELVIGKNHDQTRRITTELIDLQLRDKSENPAFPAESLVHLNMVLEAIDLCAEKCQGLPLPQNYVTPVPFDALEKGEGYPGWMGLPHEEKLRVIENVLDIEIRPYIELDEGGIKLLELRKDREIVIAYQGSCTSCFSAVGATLSTIQQIIQSKVHPDLVVVPNL